MEQRFVGIGEVAEVTLVDEHGVERQAKITPVETENCLCTGCVLDREEACFNFHCWEIMRQDKREVIFVEVKDATNA